MINATQIHGSKTKEHEYLDGWQRARAELTNIQSRLADEKIEQRQQTTKEITQELLTLSDNFSAMTEHVPAKLAKDSWTAGVLHIARQLDQVLADFGITRIEAEGKQFDPQLHEAVEQVKKSPLSSGSIIEVIQAGYQLGDDVLRPARVRVAK